MANDSEPILWASLGFGAGIYLFFKGFRVYRQYRLLADTPLMPIRSLAMGLAEIHGKARGEQLLVSPLTHTPCLLFKVDIERWQTDSKGRGSWSHYRTDINGVKFYLEDRTGRVLVDPLDAELDLIRNARREIGRSVGRSFVSLMGRADRTLQVTTRGPGDAELEAYVLSGGQVSQGIAPLKTRQQDTPEVRMQKGHPLGRLVLEQFKGSLLSGRLGWGRSESSSRRYRLTEYCIIPDHWYDVTGTCTENPNPRDLQDGNMILKGENEPTFLISWRSEEGIEGALRRRAAAYILGGATLSIACLAFLLSKFGWL